MLAKSDGVVSYRNSTSNHNIHAVTVPQQRVVSYRNSTSNHNSGGAPVSSGVVVSYRNSTSNHNTTQHRGHRCSVVSYRNSTSNHNYRGDNNSPEQLYLIEILHQTTTPVSALMPRCRCILSKFYIKPQRHVGQVLPVVGCILSKFYIKPQRRPYTAVQDNVVSYRNSTSNHNIRNVIS